jgi:hypothetical protein
MKYGIRKNPKVLGTARRRKQSSGLYSITTITTTSAPNHYISQRFKHVESFGVAFPHSPSALSHPMLGGKELQTRDAMTCSVPLGILPFSSKKKKKKNSIPWLV